MESLNPKTGSNALAALIYTMRLGSKTPVLIDVTNVRNISPISYTGRIRLV